MTDHRAAPPSSRARRALEALNFAMADMQAGIGPFLGVFLQGRGWATGAIGSVMTIGGIAGMLMTAPAGALIDATRHKRYFVIASGIFTVLASSLIWFSQSLWVVSLSQVATAVAGAAIGPAVAGITLGLVRQKGFNRQNGRNQAWNHAGNMVGAALSGFLGWKYGFGAVFLLAALFGVLAITAVLLIPEREIDHQAARGLEPGADDADGKGGGGQAEGLRMLLRNRPLLILAASLALFHLGNGALLPLYTLAVARTDVNPALFAAEMIVIAQGVMILAAVFGTRMAEARGYWLVILATFLILPVRGVIAASYISPWGVFPVQVLDGIAAGLQSVAVPGLVARILAGTGRVNVGQGAVMTVQGVGASLSPAVGGWIVHFLGYHVAFLVLGGFALGSVALWLGAADIMKPACAGRPDAPLRPLAT